MGHDTLHASHSPARKRCMECCYVGYARTTGLMNAVLPLFLSSSAMSVNSYMPTGAEDGEAGERRSILFQRGDGFPRIILTFPIPTFLA